ncbi:hypothetical protein WV31_12630 [Magnetospirillum sp. ME-1]|uniref:hypothetical protein n=1 Tax=Magnetospirillum sp. ME-1 TaxID=1639348 RepID=UPI000A17E8BE|nr:hypothetical protein [Magnetospirillum sp. ME-1]ARJ66452.1 hypothetical protein WV31_12630 [Magnetospirillum sp. ME-1]
MPLSQPRQRNWRQIELEFKARIPIRSITLRHGLTIEKLYRRARHHRWADDRLTDIDLAQIRNGEGQQPSPNHHLVNQVVCQPGCYVSRDEASAFRAAIIDALYGDHRRLAATVRYLLEKGINAIGNLNFLRSPADDLKAIVAAFDELHQMECKIYRQA